MDNSHKTQPKQSNRITSVKIGINVHSLCLLMFAAHGAEINQKPGTLAGSKVDLSHQERERVLEEIEEHYKVHKQNGGTWLNVEGIKYYLMVDRGYGDMDEFEAALGCTVEEWVTKFPHIKTQEKNGTVSLRVEEWEPQAPRILTLTVNTTKQMLNTTLYKAIRSELVIPALEFEIGAKEKRVIDTLFNHISNAITDLEIYTGTYANKDQVPKILETTAELQRMLDVKEPVTIVVRDPAGLCEFFPSEGVMVKPLVDEETSGSPVPTLSAVDERHGCVGYIIAVLFACLLALIGLRKLQNLICAWKKFAQVFQGPLLSV